MLGGVLRMRNYFHSVQKTEENHERTDEALAESEKRYRALAESAQEAIFILDRDDNIRYVNSFGAKLFGMEPSEIMGKPRKKLFPPHVYNTQSKNIGEVFKTGRTISTEALTPFLGRDIWLETTLVPMFDEKGTVNAVMGVSRDITRRKQAEERLKESVELSRAISDSSIDSIMVIDGEGKVTYFNPAAEKMFGFTSKEAAGKKLHDLIASEAARSQYHHRLPEFERTGRCKVVGTVLEVNATRKDGSRFPCELSVSAFKVDDKWYSVGTVRDSTERRRLESQLRHAQKMEAIGQLSGGIAHDFNNILTAIIGYGNIILMRMADDDPQRLNVEHMLKAADRATHLTQNLLLFGRKQEMDIRPVDLNGIIKTIEKLLVRVVGEDVSVITALYKNSINVLADSGQMEQVLMNLATNARDSMPDGGTFTIATDVIELDDKFTKVHGYGQPGEYALITVTDTGIGMDSATREKVFEPFFTTKEVGRGTGLGLSIVYGIIKQHGGYINCYSELGKGTIFKIYLPLSELPSPSLPVLEKAPAEPPRGTETILLAEDEESIRKLIKDILEEFGYRVIDAADGEEAVSRFMENKEKIKLLLLDVIMPKMNAIGVYEVIKKIRPDIKLLMISGYSADFISKKGAHGGINIISKPISPMMLLEKIREELDK